MKRAGENEESRPSRAQANILGELKRRHEMSNDILQKSGNNNIKLQGDDMSYHQYVSTPIQILHSIKQDKPVHQTSHAAIYKSLEPSISQYPATLEKKIPVMIIPIGTVAVFLPKDNPSPTTEAAVHQSMLTDQKLESLVGHTSNPINSAECSVPTSYDKSTEKYKAIRGEVSNKVYSGEILLRKH